MCGLIYNIICRISRCVCRKCLCKVVYLINGTHKLNFDVLLCKQYYQDIYIYGFYVLSTNYNIKIIELYLSVYLYINIGEYCFILNDKNGIIVNYNNNVLN